MGGENGMLAQWRAKREAQRKHVLENAYGYSHTAPYPYPAASSPSAGPAPKYASAPAKPGTTRQRKRSKSGLLFDMADTPDRLGD